MTSIGLLFLVATGCADTKDIEIAVDQTDGVPTFSWDRGDASLVSVTRCEGGCECAYTRPFVGAQQLLEGGTDVAWEVGFDFDVAEDDPKLIDEVNANPGLVGSPLGYGDEHVRGDLLDFEAQPLEPGVSYGVVVNIFGPCGDASGRGCSHVDASGCTIFEAE